MSASLGLFSVDLETKIANFVSDWGRAEREAAKQMRAIQATVEEGFKKVEEAGRKASEGAREAITALTGFSPAQLGIAAVVGGLGELTKKAIETGDQFNKMSQKVGIGVDALSGLAYSAKLADVDTESLGSGLAKFAKTASAAAGGGKEQAAAFKAIGVSVTDASGKIRPMEQLVGDVAEKFSGFEDDANKTALAIALFGKSGAQLIPFLNAGKKGIEEMSAEAKALGLNYADIAKPSEDFNDNLTRMREAAVGLGVDIARELLPHLIESEEAILRWIKAARQDGTIQNLAKAVGFLVENLDTLAVVLGTRLVIGAAVAAFTSLTAAITATGVAAATAEGVLALLGGPVGVIALAAGSIYYFAQQEDVAEQATNALKKAQDALVGATNETRASMMQALQATKLKADQDLKAAEAALANMEATARANAEAAKQNPIPNAGGYNSLAADVAAKSADKIREHITALRGALSDTNIELNLADMRMTHAGESAKRAAPNFTAVAKSMSDEAAKAASKLAEMLNKDGEVIAGLQAKLNPAQKLYSDYAKSVAEGNTAYQKEIDLAKTATGGFEQLARARTALIEKVRTLQEVLKYETDEFIRQHDVVGKYMEKISDEQSLIGLTDRQREVTKAVNDLTRAWEQNTPRVREWLASMGVVDPTSEEGRRKIEEVTGALYDNKQAWELNKEATRDWVSIFSSSADRILSTSGNLAQRFKAGWKDMIDSVIAYTAKLALINPILNSLFGGLSGAGFTMLPTLANAFGGGGVTALAQTGGQIANLANGGAGSAGAGGDFSLMSPSTWLSAGKALFSGFSNGFSSLWGGTNPIPASAQLGNGGIFGNQPAAGAGYASGFQQLLGALGGAVAGFNRMQNADGAFGKIGGGLSYGLGTYALGAGISSAIAGTGFAAGVTGAFSAIPVAGWIALGAMLLDKFSGGNLFGTSWKPTGNTQSTINVGSNGSTVINEFEEKKKSALFGGNKYKWVGMDPTDTQLDFLKQIDDAMKKVRQSAAGALATSVADIVQGAFYQKFDKDGKVLSQVSTVLGKTYIEPIEDFVKRLQAENVVAQIGKARGDDQASQVAEQYRKNAEQLNQAAQMLLQAQVDIRNGALLLGASTSLVDINKLVSDLAQQDETLIQTYQRLQAETKAMQTLFDTTGVSIGKTGADLVRFADAVAQAAGGADQLQTMIGQFAQAFYSAAEIAKAQVDALRKQSENALSGLGLDTGISKDDFRKAYEAALPTLSPEQLAQWLKAGVALGQFTDALKSYSDTLKQNAIDVQQVLDQLDPDRANKYAGTWQAALDAINQQFNAAIDKLRALGATAEQLAQAEAGRQKAIDKAKQAANDSFDAIGKQLRDGLAQLGGAGTGSQLQQAIDTIKKAETDTIDQIKAAGLLAGKSAAEIAALVGLAHTYADGQIEATKAAYRKQIEDVLGGNDTKLNPLSDYQAAIEQISKEFADQRKQLVDLGATTEQLTRLDAQRNLTLAQQATALLQSLGILPTMSEFQQSIAKIEQQERDAIDAATKLAQAQGRESANAADAARIHMWAADQIAAALSKLQARTQDIISQLYGGTPGTLDEVNRQIAELERSASGLGSAADSAASSIDSAAQAMRDQVRLQIGDLSPYNDNQKLDIAKQAYLAGNASADDVLGIARRLFTSSNDYKQVFDWVMGNQRPVTQPGTGGGTGTGNSGQLADLYKKRDELLAQQAAAQRKALASELIQNIADQAKAQHIDALALMDILKLDVGAVIKDLGIDIKHLDANGVLGLSNVAKTLNVSLDDLLKKLGIGLGDMHDGLVELTQRMGVDLAKLDATSVQKLGDLAGVLGISMKDLLTGLHLDLGSVAGGIEQMVAALGIDLSNISGTNVQALGKLAGDLHLSLSDVIGALHLNLTDIGAGLRDLATKQGIDLANLDATNLQKLTDLASTLHLSLADVASALNITIPGVSSVVNAAIGLIGARTADIIAAHTLSSREVGARFDAFASAITDMRSEQVAALRSVDAGIARLPAAIRDDRSSDLVAEMRRGADASARTADVVEDKLSQIARSSGNTEWNTSQTAVNTADSAASLRSSFVPTPRNSR